MKYLRKILAITGLIGSLGFGGAALAQLAPAKPVPETAPAASLVATQAAVDRSRKGDEVCTRCHDESETKPILSIYQNKHGVKGDPRTPGCQSCHGASEKHLGGAVNGQRPAPDVMFNKDAFPASDPKTRAAPCLTCHKGTARTHWEGSQHQNANLACNDCHTVHAPVDRVLNRKMQTEVCFACHKEQRADSHKISAHPITEGKVICSDCHNPHGSAGPSLLKKNTVTETCFMCHAEKRGPFLWEHQPVTESCVNCHTPHGSNITPLLKSRAPFLCQECHDGPHNSATAYGANVAGLQGGLKSTAPATAAANPNSSAAGRACQNCHSMVHGSNSPAGALLQR